MLYINIKQIIIAIENNIHFYYNQLDLEPTVYWIMKDKNKIFLFRYYFFM